ncbi:MAG TPA: AAA family ATPase, partial [Anaerolineae bacterium]|nr:AAA family ATPase [Anaerolineae bacterium]
MPNLPSGTVTFLFTDIEGSTRLWERQPKAMAAAMARHNAILRHAVESNGGQVFRTAGDAICAAFATAAPAVAAAAAAQQALFAEAWPVDAQLPARVALHSTEAEPEHGDYATGGLNRLGRLLAVTHGGQTLLTQATEQLARDHLPPGASLLDLGQHRFRDLTQPDRIFQLAIADLPASFPPLKTLDAISNNLPAQLTSFVGRERELEQLVARLSPSPGRAGGRGVRLLTLTGPGGTGKTRLSLQAAAEMLEHFPDGVWFVELAPVSDPALVAQTIAAALRLSEVASRPVDALLADYLRDRRLLLVLDNCEHLIDECARLADKLLRACPAMHILASSRESLGIAGEAVFKVPSLAMPDSQALPPLDELAHFDSVQLFTERAASVQPGFRLTAQNASAVAQISCRLDGIPLALELAAARVRSMSPEQIAARLDDRFRLLTGGSRAAVQRQQTLQALIDWSYDLLSPQECTLLRRLAVFASGWTLEAAEG